MLVSWRDVSVVEINVRGKHRQQGEQFSGMPMITGLIYMYVRSLFHVYQASFDTLCNSQKRFTGH